MSFLNHKLIAAAREAVAGGWTPADMTGIVEYFDTLDTSSLFSDDAGTTAAVVDGKVGHVAGQLGNFNLTQSSEATKPTYRLSGAYSWLEMAIEQWLDCPYSPEGKTVNLGLAYKNPTRSPVMIVGDSDFAPWCWVGQSGSGNSTLTRPGNTLNSAYVDGVLQSWTTRGNVFTGISGGTRFMGNFTEGDTETWTLTRIGRYGIGTFQGLEQYSGIVISEGTPTAGERANLDTWLASMVAP